MADFNEPNIMPQVNILPAGVQAIGAFVSGICDCVVSLSPLPKKAQLELSTHVREAVDEPQGQLFVPDPKRWDVV